MSVSKECIKRLQEEFIKITKCPPDLICAAPDEGNMLLWHYVVEGPSGTPYTGGFYHGKIRFPVDYPFNPPAIYMCTPSGRFQPDVRLCLSMSDYHPKDWNPMWNVSTILVGLLSFMVENQSTAGSITTTDQVKRKHAVESRQRFLNDETLCRMFPKVAERIRSLEKKDVQSPTAATADASEGRSGSSDMLFGSLSVARAKQIFRNGAIVVVILLVAALICME